MKFRKIVASMLATAMLITSSSFANVAYAAEIKDEPAVADTVKQEQTEPAAESSVTDKETTVGEKTEGEEAPVAEEKPATEEKAGEEDKPAAETPADEEIPVDEATEAVKPADAAVDPDQAVDAVDEVPEETEALEESDGLLKSTDYFEVDGGVLKRKKISQTSTEFVPLQEDVKIPADCVTIPVDIFQNDRVVKTIRFDKSYDNNGQPVNEQKLTTIADNAFENSAIEEIIGLPSGVTQIPKNCFLGSNLKSITYETDSTNTKNSSQQRYSKSIETIETNAFKGVRFDNTSLEFYGCKTIKESAFEDSNITEILLKEKGQGQDNNIVTIGNSAFKNCSNLRVLGSTGQKWPKTIRTIGTGAFEGTALSYVDLSDIPLTAINLGPGTFKNCKQLTSFVFQKNATEIPNNLFSGCTALKEVAFPEPDKDTGYYGVWKIGFDAFYNCTSLAEISLYNAIYIEQTAFGNCNNLKNIYFGYDPEDAGLKAKLPPEAKRISDFIFDSAFPNNSRKTAGYIMHGYDDDFLMEYARKHNYSYETRNKIYKATPDCQDATVKVVPEKILPGEKVTVTVTPKSGFSLWEFRVLKDKSFNQIPAEVTLESYDRSKQVFSFEMPQDADYDLCIKPVVKRTTNISLNGLKAYLNDGTTDIGYNDAGGTGFQMDGGKKYQIIMKNSTETLPEWLWSYSSDRQDSVAVNSTGVLSTLRSNNNAAHVTVKMLSGSGQVKFTVVVNDVLNIKRVYVKGGENKAKTWKESNGIVIPAGKNQLEVKTRNTTDGDGNAVLYPVVRIPKSLVAVGDYAFDVNINAYTDNAINPATDPKVVKSNWTTTDTTIAKPVAATSTTNNNTVRIVKGSQGEAAIGITTLNYDEKKVNGNNTEDTAAPNIEYNETFVIVEVWDDTPRIAEKEIVINAQRKENLVTLFNAYADDGDNASGKVYDDGMFKVYYDSGCTKPCKDFTIEYNKDKQRMNFVTTDEYDDRTALNKTNNYKGLWLDVTLYNRGKYIIPLPNVKIENKPLAAKVTSTGKLNLFYNTQAAPDEQGNVLLTHNITSETLLDVDLISTDNYKKYGKRAAEKVYTVVNGDKRRNAAIEDKFYDNFTVAPAGARWSITRKTVAGTPHDIYTDNNKKAILSGYIYLYYANYKYPVMQAYTVPSEITAPKYSITPASETGHTSVPNREYEVQLIDQWKNPVSINGGQLSDDGGTTASVVPNGLWIDGDKTKNKSIKTDAATLTKNLATNNTITLGVSGTPSSGVAVIRIHMKKWSDYDGRTDDPKYLRYNFNLTVSSTAPRVTASASRVNFNLAYPGEKFEILYTSSLPIDAPVVGFKNLTYSGSATTAAEAKKLVVTTNNNGAAISLNYDDATMQATSDKKLTFSLPAAGIKAGTYSYKVTPVVQYAGDGEKPNISPIAFTVSIADNNPTIKLTNPTFTINYLEKIADDGQGDYGATSYCETKYTLAGLSSGTVANDYSVSLAGATVTPLTTGADPFGNLAAQSVTAPAAGGIYKVARKGATRSAFTYKYRVSGATISNGALTATLKDFDITIRGVQVEPVTTAKATGSLNFVDSRSRITYDFTIKNVQGNVTALELFNVLPDGSLDQTNFAAATVANNKVQVRIIEPKGIKPNTNYKLRFRFGLTSIKPAQKYELDVNVRPVQTFPRVTATYGSRNYIYAGEDTIASGASALADLDRKLSLYVNVPVATSTNYHVVSDQYPVNKTNSKGEYVIPLTPVSNGVRWAANTPDSYKRAFNVSDVTYVGDGVYRFELTMKNAAAVQQNKDLTLNFLVYFHGQAINTNGVPVSYKIQVRK